MKKLLVSMVALFICLVTLVSCGNKNEEIIAIVKYTTHTSLDEIEDKIYTDLKGAVITVNGEEVKLTSKYTIKKYNCMGSTDTTSQIMQNLARKKVKCIIPIATPVAIAAEAKFKDIPIVFAAVSDPVSAGLVTDLNAPNANVTGTSDAIQIDKILDKANLIKPISKLGFIYSLNESNSLSNLEKIKTYCEIKGITLETKGINETNEIRDNSINLASKVDAMIITDDNKIASSISQLVTVCRDKKIPLYCGADSEVKDGGMLSVGINYTDLGASVAAQTIKVLSGNAINTIPVKVFNENLLTYINTTYTKAIDFNISDSILNDTDTRLVEDKE